MAEGEDGFGIDILLMVAVPSARQHRGMGVSHVGSVAHVIVAFALVLGGEEVGGDLGAVNALPAEGIVGHGVAFVPADLAHYPFIPVKKESVHE